MKFMQQISILNLNRSIYMAKMFQVYGIGQALIPVLPPPLPFQTAPTVNQTNYEIGQLVFTPPHSPTAFYLYGGGGNWIQISDVNGPVQSVTGTANQILASPTSGNVILSLIGPYTPATYTAHGVLIGEGTSSIVATSAGTAGQLLVSGGASADPTWTTATFPTTVGAAGTILRSNGTGWVASTDTYPDTVVAGDLLLATATNVIGSLADVATGQVLMSGGVGVAPAYSGSPSVSGSLTAATTITATLGAITATNGNFVGSTAGSGILLNSPAASGVAASPVIVNGRSGKATFTSVSIAAAADLTLTITNSAITASTTQVLYSMSGATTGSALSIKSVTNSAGSSAIVVTNGTGATTSTADIVMNFLVLNA
jgi:hypothetical protein